MTKDPRLTPDIIAAITSVTIESLLRELVTVNRAILATLERQPRPTALSHADRMRLTRMLPALAGAYGSAPFTSRDLVEDASAAVRLVVQGLSAKSIGRLLARAEGIALDGLMVQRHGTAINVVAWFVGSVSSVSQRHRGIADPDTRG